jgi:hypothetical protein
VSDTVAQLALLLLSLLDHALPFCLWDVQILRESPGKLPVSVALTVWKSLGQIQTDPPIRRRSCLIV